MILSHLKTSFWPALTTETHSCPSLMCSHCHFHPRTEFFFIYAYVYQHCHHFSLVRALFRALCRKKMEPRVRQVGRKETVQVLIDNTQITLNEAGRALGSTRWQRTIGCIRVQVFSRKRATNFRGLWRK